jgi:uncharacterized oligopeptide transporter (OPT) family protein
MIDETKPASAWSSSRPASTESWTPPETPLARFLGGTPGSVLLRLFFLSLIVGALLMWLDIRPVDLVQGVIRFVHRIWSLGFDALREMGDYIVAGAMIVVPLWLIARLFNMREPR